MTARNADLIEAERVPGKLRRLGGWEHLPKEKAIRRTYQLSSFRAAVAFVDYVAELAEDAEHHPDIDVRYRKVTLTLSTHSAGGVTDKDFELARRIDQR